jgi:fumarate hydratase class II
VAAFDLLQSIGLLARAAENLARLCIDGLKATDRGPHLVERNAMLATALAPVIGYDQAAAIAKEAQQSGQSIKQVAAQRTRLDSKELDRLLDPARMTEPRAEAGSTG